MTGQNEDIFDVVIVGGGPVGLALAIDLGQRGRSVCLIERYLEPVLIPKGQNLTQRTMEHFLAWGVEPEIRAACPIPKSYGIGGMTAYGTLLSGYHYDWLKRQLVRPYYSTDNERLPQYDTERVLRARVEELDTVQTRYGWRVTGLEQTENSVTVTATAVESSLQIAGRYVVGCDGSRSVIRDAAGISETRRDHDKLMVLLVFKSEELHELLAQFPGKSFYNVLHPDLNGYWQFVGRVDLGSTWFFHAPVPMDTTESNFDFVGYLHRAIGAEFALDMERIGFWNLRIAVADSYRAGRVFIAGDAAHSHPPYGGYGINTGLEDARNLAWKLTLVLDGAAEPSLLETYDAERRPVFASTAKDFIETSIEDDRQFLQTFDPQVDRDAFKTAWNARSEGAISEVGAFEPHYEGSPIIPDSIGAPSALGSHSFKARPGHHIAPRLTARGVPLTDHLGQDFTLVLIGAEEGLIAEAQSVLADTRLPITLVVEPSGGDLADYESSAMLVRPDHFVAWVAQAGLSGLTRTLRAMEDPRPTLRRTAAE